MDYWQERALKSQEILTDKSIKQTEKQLRKYYKKTTDYVVAEFEATYTKLLNTVVRDNMEPTPADLYKLDRYWTLQNEMREELYKLGDLQAKALQNQFRNHYINIYESLGIGKDFTLSHMTKETAEQMINIIWCADGKAWSDRVWANVDKLREELNEGLIECVLGGKDERYLKQRLVEQFGVSYNRAESIVETELAHIQTQAAQQRYKDLGVDELQVWTNDDERRCKICGKLHLKKFGVNDRSPLPAHPRCRCCVIPVI